MSDFEEDEEQVIDSNEFKSKRWNDKESNGDYDRDPSLFVKPQNKSEQKNHYIDNNSMLLGPAAQSV